ncbi:unnamed protein product [Rotaria socialis]|uniref:MIT domain-containing protein n=1 Tax=Rotaria socialis TaxID=392032 RepID=A0A818KLT1_9BILA|nr:unnamed protein product [Rotaria socialis]CAF3371077.1 unnamed protein product [Rotaria socialis]CAF3445684.1 unnamed protein product [Rotaria socialis]CAF3454905.1 unnamed protein product [Rotaria socialis]CAF3560253.1 unnamed protein product [Rotaria socialis]
MDINTGVQIPMTPINENVCFSVCTSKDDFDKLKQGLTLLEQAKVYDHNRDYYTAIRYYRDGVDYLMDEFMSRASGNEQSKEYLRLKCHKILNRVDILKKLIKQQEHETMQEAIDDDEKQKEIES